MIVQLLNQSLFHLMVEFEGILGVFVQVFQFQGAVLVVSVFPVVDPVLLVVVQVLVSREVVCHGGYEL